MKLNIQTESIIEQIKTNPYLQLALMALFVIIAIGLMIDVLVDGMAERSKLERVQLDAWQKEETRKQERCEAANGQYVQYDGVMTCLALPLDPTLIKER